MNTWHPSGEMIVVHNVRAMDEVPGVKRAVVIAIGSVARAIVDFVVGDEVMIETTSSVEAGERLLLPCKSVLAFTRIEDDATSVAKKAVRS